MKTQKIEIRIDAVNLSREMSREAFKQMRSERRIPDKRRKQPKHKNAWREE